MTYDITITFTAIKIEGEGHAKDLGIAIAEHVVDTFNDEGDISPLVTVIVKRKGRR